MALFRDRVLDFGETNNREEDKGWHEMQRVVYCVGDEELTLCKQP